MTHALGRETHERRDTSWMDHANCLGVDVEHFFTPDPATRGIGNGYESVITVYCRPCPVRAQCLERAIATDDRWGVMGGLSPEERAKIRRPKSVANQRKGA